MELPLALPLSRMSKGTKITRVMRFCIETADRELVRIEHASSSPVVQNGTQILLPETGAFWVHVESVERAKGRQDRLQLLRQTWKEMDEENPS